MNSNEIWIALIGAASGILTALGFGKIIPSILKCWEEWRENKRTLKKEEAEKLQSLLDRVDQLENEISEYKNFKTRTDTAFRLMLPVISDVMRDHPNHIALFEQLKNIIFNEVDSTSADGRREL